MNNEPLIPDGCEKPAQIDLLRRTVLKEGVKLAYALPLVLASIQAAGAATLSQPVGGGTAPGGTAPVGTAPPPPGGTNPGSTITPGGSFPGGTYLPAGG
jgi:hypothetical protein